MTAEEKLDLLRQAIGVIKSHTSDKFGSGLQAILREIAISRSARGSVAGNVGRFARLVGIPDLTLRNWLKPNCALAGSFDKVFAAFPQRGIDKEEEGA